MLDFDQTNLLYFYSTLSQVFGALLGLIAISYVRFADDRSANINDQFKLLVQHLEHIEGPLTDENIEINDASELLKFLKKFESKSNKKKFDKTRKIISSIQHEQNFKKTQDTSFKKLSLLLVALVITGITGCLFVNTQFINASTVSFFTYFTLVLSIFACYLTYGYFTVMTRSRRVISHWSE